MRNLFITFALLILLCAGCSKNQSIRTSNLSTPLIAISSKSFRNAKEPQIAQWIYHGQLPSTEETKKCVKEESVGIHKYCLLLWALKNSPDKELDQAIRSNIESDIIFVKAAAFKVNILADIDSVQALRIVSFLKGSSEILRALFLANWVRSKNALDRFDRESLKEMLTSLDESKPYSLFVKKSLLETYFSGSSAEMIQSYCSKTMREINKIRCWRFISVVANQPTVFNPIKEYMNGDPWGLSWKFFEKSMPARALLLKSEASL